MGGALGRRIAELAVAEVDEEEVRHSFRAQNLDGMRAGSAP